MGTIVPQPEPFDSRYEAICLRDSIALARSIIQHRFPPSRDREDVLHALDGWGIERIAAGR